MDSIFNMLMVLCQLIVVLITLRRRERARRGLMIGLLIQGYLDTPRRASPQPWQRPRTSLWWEIDVLGHYTNREWLTSFRMTRQTFERLCEMLTPSIQPDPSSRRPPVPLQKRVAIAVYKLASCCEYRVVAGKFGVSITTVHRCVYAVCRAITSELLHRYVKMPSADEARQIAYRNALKHHIPQIYGAIDGSHIPILPPLDGYRDYINRKRWASVILQAVVDDRGLFRNIFAGIPGSSHDAAVLKQSSLFNNPALHPQASIAIDGLDIPLMVVGDPAYPLLPWLIKAYHGPQLTPAQEAFNENLNSIRVSVEHSFGRLKGRWRVLHKRSDIHHSFMPTVIAACCVLHNICEMEHHAEYVGLPPAPDSQPPGRPCEDEFPEANVHNAHLVRNALLEHVQNALNL